MLKPELRGSVDVFVSSMVEQRIRKYLYYGNLLCKAVLLGVSRRLDALNKYERDISKKCSIFVSPRPDLRYLPSFPVGEFIPLYMTPFAT